MRSKEFIDEAKFMNSPCTKDCSGHKAGYEWSKRNNSASASTKSTSFNQGAFLAKNYKKPPDTPTTSIAEATGDDEFDRMMRGITDPNALATHDRDERAHIADHEFLQLGDHVWAHLEKLGRQMLKKPQRLDWYVQKINSGDYAAISDWTLALRRELGVDPGWLLECSPREVFRNHPEFVTIGFLILLLLSQLEFGPNPPSSR